MRKSERLAEKQNIDYLSLHTTGKKYTQNTDSNSITELTQLLGDISISEINVNMEKLFTQVSILTQDILDFIDENHVDNSNNISDLDMLSNEVTKYRTGFRTVHTEIKNQLGDAQQNSKILSRKYFLILRLCFLKTRKSRTKILGKNYFS